MTSHSARHRVEFSISKKRPIRDKTALFSRRTWSVVFDCKNCTPKTDKRKTTNRECARAFEPFRMVPGLTSSLLARYMIPMLDRNGQWKCVIPGPGVECQSNSSAITSNRNWWQVWIQPSPVNQQEAKRTALLDEANKVVVDYTQQGFWRPGNRKSFLERIQLETGTRGSGRDESFFHWKSCQKTARREKLFRVTALVRMALAWWEHQIHLFDRVYVMNVNMCTFVDCSFCSGCSYRSHLQHGDWTPGVGKLCENVSGVSIGKVFFRHPPANAIQQVMAGEGNWV